MNEHMGDLDRVRDELHTLKWMADEYTHWATECTNPGIRDMFEQLHGQAVHSHNICFSFLHTRAAYPVATATADRLQEVRRHYAAVGTALPRDVGRPGVPARETGGAETHPH